MKRLYYMPVLLVMFMMMGCAAHQQMSPTDRALTYWHQYGAYEATYKSHMTSAQTEKEREKLANSVGVMLDRVRPLLIVYSQSVYAGVPDQTTQIELIGMLRQISFELWRVKE